MMKLKKKINGIICTLFAAVLLFTSVISYSFMISSRAADEDATIVVSLDKNTMNVGDTFNVKVTYESNLDSGYLTWTLEYDNSLVSREGSSGKIIETEWFDDSSANTKNVTKSYTFTAKAVGKVSFSISATSYKLVPDENGDAMTILAMGASATIADVGSNDANLKSLVIDGGELVPAFSPDVTEYTVTVPFDISALYVYPTTSDSRATHTVEGDEFLNVGTKTRTVVVTAQDGTVKKYAIKITRLAKPTEAPTQTPVATERPPETAEPTKPPTQEPTETPVQTVLPSATPSEDIVVATDGKKYKIVDVSENITVPEGFEKTEVKYRSNTYTGAKGISKKLTLLNLESEEFSGLFVYDSDNNVFFRYVEINVKSGIYTYMRLLDGDKGLAFNKTRLSIGDSMVDAYEISPDEKEFYIIRAMNWNGKISYYTYDTLEGTMQRYTEIKFMSDIPEETESPVAESTESPLSTPIADSTSDIEDNKNENNLNMNKMLLILSVSSCVLCLVLAAFLIYFAIKERKTCEIMNSSFDEETEKNEATVEN